MVIRELQDNDLQEAIQLKVLCWPEELAGMSDKKYYGLILMQEEEEYRCC